MKELIEQALVAAPGIGFLLALVVAFLSAYRVALPLDWSRVRAILWQELKVSIDINVVRLEPASSILTSIAYLRSDKTCHNGQENREALDLYDRCWTHRLCFWWSDKTTWLFLVTFMLCLVLFTDHVWAAAACVLGYFITTVVARMKAQEIGRSLTDFISGNEKRQVDYLQQGHGEGYRQLI